MTLPIMLHWTATREGLHQAAQVLGAVRAAVAGPEPNWTHIALRVTPNGLTTGSLSSFGELAVDFLTRTILYTPPQGDPVGFALARHTQVTLADAVENALESLGHPVSLKRDKLVNTAVFDLSPRDAANYAQVLNVFNGALQRFRAGLPGEKSPVVVWPHGFDCAFLWFATAVAAEDAPHMSFGFSPHSAGLDFAYLYTYSHPVPANVTDLTLPPNTRWHTTGWTGTITEYESLATQTDPAGAIEQTLQQIYRKVAPLLT